MTSKNDGFTLIEFILTILIIGIIAAFVLPVFGDIFGSIFSARDKTRATFDAQSLIVDSVLDKNEDGDPSNNITMKLVDKDDNDNIIFSDIDVEKREETTEYNLPKSISQDLSINYYIYIPSSP